MNKGLFIGVLGLMLFGVILILISIAMIFPESADIVFGIIVFIVFALIVAFLIGVITGKIPLGKNGGIVIGIIGLLIGIWIVCSLGLSLVGWLFSFVSSSVTMTRENPPSTVRKIEPKINPDGTIFVSAKEMDGVDTELNIPDDSTISISASGNAIWINNPKAKPVTYAESDPAGLSQLKGMNQSEYRYQVGFYLCPQANMGALIARVGDGKWFQVGKNHNRKISKGGRLRLAINDRQPQYGNGNWTDNSGGYSVKVKVMK